MSVGFGGVEDVDAGGSRATSWPRLAFALVRLPGARAINDLVDLLQMGRLPEAWIPPPATHPPAHELTADMLIKPSDWDCSSHQICCTVQRMASAACQASTAPSTEVEMNAMTLPTVEIVEVGPRDGLQNEPDHFSTEQKIEYISQVVGAGIRRVEATSFVNPHVVPQMSDAENVIQGAPQVDGVIYAALVHNMRGLERALAVGVKEVNFGLSVTQTFNSRNQNVGVLESVAEFGRVSRAGREASIRVTLVLGVAFGCPFEGEVPLSRLEEVLRRVMEHGPAEVALGDTIGCASPADVSVRVRRTRELVGADMPIRVHLHNTRNAGLANAYAAVEAGASSLDASTGGLGGCPFAPKATGNIATEDLLYMLQRMGRAPAVRLSALTDTAQWLERQLGRKVEGALSHAGPFPAADGLLGLTEASVAKTAASSG